MKLSLLSSTLLLITMLTLADVSGCPPSGCHLGIIVDEGIDARSAVSKLKAIGVEAWLEPVKLKADGGYIRAETVVFYLGYWLPVGLMLEWKPTPAYARLYAGGKYSCIKVNTTLECSLKPLKDAIALLLKADILGRIPDIKEAACTPGNTYPCDAVVEWAKLEAGVKLEQVTFRCLPRHLNIVVPGAKAEHKAAVVANSIDMKLCYEMLEKELKRLGYECKPYAPRELKEALDSEVLIALGGPLAYEEAGRIAEFLLPPPIASALVAEEEYSIAYLHEPLFSGQTLLVIAGHTRDETRREAERLVREGILARVLSSPVKAYYSCRVSCVYSKPSVSVEPSLRALYLKAVCELPNPCYYPIVDTRIEGSMIKVHVSYEPLSTPCIQCIAYASLYLSIIGIEPGEYTLRVDGYMHTKLKVKIPG